MKFFSGDDDDKSIDLPPIGSGGMGSELYEKKKARLERAKEIASGNEDCRSADDETMEMVRELRLRSRDC